MGYKTVAYSCDKIHVLPAENEMVKYPECMYEVKGSTIENLTGIKILVE